MIFHREDASVIAKERLKLMLEADSLEYSNDEVSRLKQEIATLVSRYFDVSAQQYEIKIKLKQDKKRV